MMSKENEKITSMVTNLKLFLCWDDVPGVDSDKLINFLKRNGVSWETEEDTKISIKKDSNIVTVSYKEDSFPLILDKKKMEAVLKVSRFRTFSFVAKPVEGRIYLYDDFKDKIRELDDQVKEDRKKLEKTIGAKHKSEYLNTEFGDPLRYEILFTHDWVGILFLYLLHVREDNCHNIASNFEKAISKEKFVPPEVRGITREKWKKYTLDSLDKMLGEYLEYMSAEGLILSRLDLPGSSSKILYRLHPEFFYSGDRILTTSKIQSTKKYPPPNAIYKQEIENKKKKGSAKADHHVKSNIINRNISLVLLELIAKATNAWEERWTKQNQNKIMTIIENIGTLNDYSYSAVLIYTWAAMLPLLSLLQMYRCNKGIKNGYFKPEIADIAEAVDYYQSYSNTRRHETCIDSSSIPSIECKKKTFECIDKFVTKQKIYSIERPQKDSNWNITKFSLIKELKDIIITEIICKVELFLFTWDKIPGEHNDKLREILLKDYSIDLSKESRIEKINDGQIIYVPDDNPIRLERRQTKAILKIGDRQVDEFIVKREEEGWKIYKKLDINKDYPECFYKNKDIDLLKAIEGLTEQSDMIRSILMFNFADSTGVLRIGDFFAPSSSIYDKPK